MTAMPRISLAPLRQITHFVPLVALGFHAREQDLLRPIYSRLAFSQTTHVSDPVAVILDLWVSILAGCSSVSHINTKIRPDRLLAQAWGRPCFSEQSTVARILDACQDEQVSQLSAAVEVIYRWIGQGPRHLRESGEPLTIDIDLTGLPAGRQAEGSSKGYFSGQKGGVDASCAVSERPTMARAFSLCCIPATL